MLNKLVLKLITVLIGLFISVAAFCGQKTFVFEEQCTVFSQPSFKSKRISVVNCGTSVISHSQLIKKKKMLWKKIRTGKKTGFIPEICLADGFIQSEINQKDALVLIKLDQKKQVSMKIKVLNGKGEVARYEGSFQYNDSRLKKVFVKTVKAFQPEVTLIGIRHNSPYPLSESISFFSLQKDSLLPAFNYDLSFRTEGDGSHCRDIVKTEEPFFPGDKNGIPGAVLIKSTEVCGDTRHEKLKKYLWDGNRFQKE